MAVNTGKTRLNWRVIIAYFSLRFNAFRLDFSNRFFLNFSCRDSLHVSIFYFSLLSLAFTGYAFILRTGNTVNNNQTNEKNNAK